LIPTPLHRDAILRSDPVAFSQKAFEQLNPGIPFQNNWHIEKLGYALERVLRGECTRVIVNMPPRSLKSLIGSVAFPAFALGRDPQLKFICVSYSQQLADKFSSDFRRIREAEWYRRLWPARPPVKNTEAEYQTVEGGFRFATSVGGTLTGRGGDVIIVDDPHNALEVGSKASREQVKNWFTGSLLSRLDDKKTGAIIVIAQRLHQDDLTGYLLEQGGWEVLTLPAIAPADLKIRLSDTHWYKWRAGEPLHEAREPLSLLEDLKRQLGIDKFNAQYLQAPVPETGNILKRAWFRSCDVAPIRQAGDRIVQSWDTAMKATDTCDYSVCLTFLVRNNNQYYLLDVYRERVEFPDLVKQVNANARKFGADTILIEDKGSGTSLIQTVKRSGQSGVIGIRPTMDKGSRMNGQTPKLEAGSLYLPVSAPGQADFLAECLAFPLSQHDDQVDALSQFLEWQSNREAAVFEFDFGYEDIGPPSPETLLAWRGR
jgi:predicted phage terminase large subunit-like protein